MATPNYYHTLGVPEDSDEEVIKQRYRELARVLHPDRNRRPTAEEEFKDLQEAFAVLSDPSQRRQHNATLALAKVSDLPPDPIDNVMSEYGIEPHVKKKKKKKKKVKVPKQAQRHFPPSEADYEDIPDGFEPRTGFL